MAVRQRYKQDFNREYEEYRRLHENIEHSTLVFSQLRERLYQEQEGSLNYEVSTPRAGGLAQPRAGGLIQPTKSNFKSIH